MSTRKMAVPPIDEEPGMCGPCSLCMVLRYYGDSATPGEVSKECGTIPSKGTHPREMIRVAKMHGFSAAEREGMNLGDLERSIGRGVPVIVDWDPHDEGPVKGSHYSTVVQVTGKDVLLQDPEPGKVVAVPRADFERKWIDGYGLMVETRKGKMKGWAEKKLG